ncbi:DUF6325 family protein [Rathayibacter soli]|uniref:DUF6325 family protein n=1 Tax=Rathayibacter soli TaxID=3144168 RepID=UPI0027E4BCA7|nr:DUF6325 family protein [Glaciibacter superstes]
MADFTYGPVEFMLIGFAGSRPGPEVVGAILNLIESDTAKLLDMVFASRSSDGELTVLELEEVADDFGLAGLEIDELGLAGEDDIDEFADQIEPGTSAALLVVEHVWAREFAAALYRAGGQVLYSQRIPAPAVNELVGSLGD